jgi:predicted nucleic acid-binding protein
MGSCAPAISASLLFEYRDVLSRDDLFWNARLDAAQRALLLRAFVSRCEWQQVHFLWRPNLRDEADNRLIELAVAANCSIIVTNNVRDLEQRDLKFPDIRALKPEQLLEEIRR